MSYVNYIDFIVEFHYTMYLNCHELDTVGLNDLCIHNRLGPA